jgi:hypothetical protein
MSLYNPEGTPPTIAAGVARVERRLPYPGEVLVRTGGRVEPEDIVARAFVPAPPQIINIAQTLGVPASRVPQVLRHKEGGKVRQGENLARAGAALGHSCVAPVSGIISSIDTVTGYVTIAPDPTEMTLNAALRGIAMEILPHRGIVIETPASQVYGVFGCGGERNGVLRLMLIDASEVITPDHIDARSTFSILVSSGAGITAAALQRAVQEQVRGVVVGSIDERELRAFLGWSSQQAWYTGSGGWQFPNMRSTPDPGLTLIVTEGFGARPMSPPLFDLLSAKDRQEALIDGTTCLRQPLRRPRLIVPLARGSGDVEPPRPQIKPGVQVRLLDAAHLGQVASVRTVSLSPRRTESGVRASVVEVVQDDTPPFWLPRTAVEVLAE